jgi:hypothetical protein
LIRGILVGSIRKNQAKNKNCSASSMHEAQVLVKQMQNRSEPRLVNVSA